MAPHSAQKRPRNYGRKRRSGRDILMSIEKGREIP
jgi:hypothetical protein